MSLLNEYLQDPEYKRLLAQEELIMEVTELLCQLLEKEGVSRRDLAKRLNRSKGFVSQLLNGGRNLTLRTVADIAAALGYRLVLTAEKKMDTSRIKPFHFDQDTCQVGCMASAKPQAS
jgi:transcriptional regulator with XRE-family HTH domain